jgi:hypothetical protein
VASIKGGLRVFEKYTNYLHNCYRNWKERVYSCLRWARNAKAADCPHGELIGSHNSKEKTISGTRYVPVEKLFAAMVYSDEKKGKIDVYLVNVQKDVHYERLVSFNGGFMSSDDDLLETSKTLREYGQLNSMSALRIDLTDDYELDFTIWYMIDMYEQGNPIPSRITFSLPRYGWFDKKKHIDIPILDAIGYQIEVVDAGVPDKRVESMAE